MWKSVSMLGACTLLCVCGGLGIFCVCLLESCSCMLRVGGLECGFGFLVCVLCVFFSAFFSAVCCV